MNRSRSNRARLFGKRNVRGLLPAVPCDVHIEPWWRVEVGMVLEDDIKVIFNNKCEFFLYYLFIYNHLSRWLMKKN